jgi:hypothetical protein
LERVQDESTSPLRFAYLFQHFLCQLLNILRGNGINLLAGRVAASLSATNMPQQLTIMGDGLIIVSILMSMDAIKVPVWAPTTIYVVYQLHELASSSTPLLKKCQGIGGGFDDNNSTPAMAFSPNRELLRIGVIIIYAQEDQDPTKKNLSPLFKLQLYVVPE